jgi:hypothetical protein
VAGALLSDRQAAFPVEALRARVDDSLGLAPGELVLRGRAHVADRPGAASPAAATALSGPVLRQPPDLAGTYHDKVEKMLSKILRAIETLYYIVIIAGLLACSAFIIDTFPIRGVMASEAVLIFFAASAWFALSAWGIAISVSSIYRAWR